jgi:hypothetical protein
VNSYNGFTSSERAASQRWENAQYANGTRSRPTTCEACEQTDGWLEAHTEDYSKPYGDHIGRWGLCYRCHMILHCRFRYPAAFAEYCKALTAGKRFAPIHTRNFPLFASQQLHGTFEPYQSLGRPLPGFQAMLDEGRKAAAQRTGQAEIAF